MRKKVFSTMNLQKIKHRSAFVWMMALVVLFCTMPHAVQAQVSTQAMGAMLVLEDGRIKPLDTYARSRLLQFSGRKKIGDLSATQWFAQLMFDPGRADEHKVFLIDNPDVLDALKIQKHKRRYSYAQIFPGLSELQRLAMAAGRRDPSEQSAMEKEVLRLFRNVQDYIELTGAFTFLEGTSGLAVSDTALASALGLTAQKPLSYLEVLGSAPKLSVYLQQLDSTALREPDANQRVILQLSHWMYEVGQSVQNPHPHMVPQHSAQEEYWASPWGVLSKQGSKALEDPLFSAIIMMRGAYLDGDQGAFERALAQVHFAQQRSSIHQLPNPQLELAYNRINAFLWSKICYGLALLFALIGLMVSHRAVVFSSRTLVWLGLGMHSFGLVARMVIMGRPPLSTLYETFLFAGWTAVLLGIAMDFFQKRSPGALVSSIGGFIMIHMAGKFGGDGDTMGMLVAVLNNNFWLATHITTIMLGYAGVCSAGVIGHVYLLQRMIAPQNRDKLTTLERSIYGALAFGFIFTVIGTLFGGLWAQQSWGRFWGWDPKENGALLIILWCSIVFHARAGGWMRQAGTAAGAIVGFVVVMMTWLGVNLLGVGLHSYGFTTAGAIYLFSIMGGETLFLLIAWVLIGRKRAVAEPQQA